MKVYSLTYFLYRDCGVTFTQSRGGGEGGYGVWGEVKSHANEDTGLLRCCTPRKDGVEESESRKSIKSGAGILEFDLRYR